VLLDVHMIADHAYILQCAVVRW